MNNSSIKLKSKQLISGKTGKSTLILIFSILTVAFFSVLPFASQMVIGIEKVTDFLSSVSPYVPYIAASITVALILIWAISAAGSFSMGTKAWFSSGVYNKKNRGRRMLFWFKPKRAFHSAGLYLTIFLLNLLWAIALLSPGVLLLASAIVLTMTGGIEINIFICIVSGGAGLTVIGIMFLFVISGRYFLAPYLFAQDPNLKIGIAIKRSKNLLDGSLWRLAAFKLSFVPWFCLYVFILPAIYVWPYYKQSCALFAKEVCL